MNIKEETFLKKEVMNLIRYYLNGKLTNEELSDLAVILVIESSGKRNLFNEKENRSLAIAIVDMIVLNNDSKKYYVSDNNLKDDLKCLTTSDCFLR